MTVRRSHDRRRRVLYSGGIEPASRSAAERRRVEQLRQARRPVARYGQRVQRRLQARWYSIVPVRSRTYWLASATVLTVAVTLVIAHVASIRMEWIRDHGDISRPLRLDRSDSFGRYFQTTLFLYASGISLLIYQLRRYRLDDYQGAYRLWRTVLVMTLIGGVNSACGLIDWSGATIDAVVGRRLALSGSDWIRMITSMGLTLLSIRVLVDIRQNRFAVATLATAGILIVVPELFRWNVFVVETLNQATMLPAAATLATALMVIGLNGYLRVLYRDVQEIEAGPTLRQRISSMGLSVIPRRSQESDDARGTQESDDRVARDAPASRSPSASSSSADSSSVRSSSGEHEAVDSDPPPKRRRLWDSLRRRRAADDADESETADDSAVAKETANEGPVARRRRGRKPAPQPEPHSSDESNAVDDTPSTDGKRKRGLGLGRFLRRRPATPDEASEESAENRADSGANGAPDRSSSPGKNSPSKASPSQSSPSQGSPSQNSQPQGSPGQSGDDFIDPDEIDWASLSKSERRRLKKVIKRQGRAA